MNNVETTVVGIHVRRSDMVDNKQHYAYGFRTGDQGFVERAMRFYIKRFKSIVFIVCSDDIPWCKQHIYLPSDINKKAVKIHYCDRSSTPIIDLGILSSCNHSIITGGTFGWWSAFLAGGQTVYYKGFPRPNTNYSKQFSRTRADYYLPHWIGMD